MLVLTAFVIKVDLVKALKEVARLIASRLNQLVHVFVIAVAGVMASSSPA